MNKNPVLVIAEKKYHEFYNNFALKNEIFEVFPYEDITEFLEHIHPDLVLIDCGFNVNKGLSLLRGFKSLYTSIPIIFTSEFSSEDIAIEVFRSGAREFLKKPYSIIELKKSIESLLKIKRSSKGKRKPLLLSDLELTRDNYSLSDTKLPINITDAIRYIEDNLRHDICLERLAKEASLSKFHFCKSFKKHTGMTPLKYVNAMRIEKAKMLLPKNDLNISKVAMEVGFNDISNFNKHFRKHTGVSPTIYKSIHNEMERGQQPPA